MLKILKSGSLVSTHEYDYLLISSPPNTTTLFAARKSGNLSPAADTLIQLAIGAYLRELHTLQNDWFGLPISLPHPAAPADASYVWQETFTLLLETVMCTLEERGLGSSSASHSQLEMITLVNKHMQLQAEDWEDLRRALSRAIVFFVFDDADVPSLVGFTPSEADVLVRIPSTTNADLDAYPGPEPEVWFPLPTHALWGDPMMEACFMLPGPGTALLEGYMAGEEGSLLMPFARQRTKRLWYTLFLMGSVLLDAPRDESEENNGIGDEEGKWRNVRNTFADCVLKLKDAPCY